MLQIVLARAIGAAIGMVLIAVIYVILQNLAQKGMDLFVYLRNPTFHFGRKYIMYITVAAVDGFLRLPFLCV